jgi:methionyl-tRNA synthetase
MNSPKRHLVTCALPYANGPLHIGHIAGCFLPSDIYVRFLKSIGEDVLFVCGTDEHGVPITLKARNEGITPQQVVDENYEIIRSGLETWGIEFDNFSRTSREVHHKTATEFFKNLYDKGVFTEKITQQFFDEKANQFLADRYIIGTCPNCSYDNAYGDQCEQCGRTLSPMELINPRSALTGEKPILKETKNWFLPLDRIQKEFLNEWVEDKKEAWKVNVYGQCKSWLTDGLQPRAMTRDLDWGVPVPIEGAEGKVMYVWFDAPIGYISATREIRDDWQMWWQDPGTELTHFLGKDNIVFHTLIFPAMLHEHGSYITPTNVPANEFLNLEGQKLSTSRNHAVWLHEYLEDFPNREDELRYVLTAIMPETKDSDFTWGDYQARVNNELVAILGNWVNRVMVLTHKFSDGIVPAHSDQSQTTVLDEAKSIISEMHGHLWAFRFREAQSSLMSIARLGNKYLQDTAPWHAIKEKNGQQTVNNILNVSLQLVQLFAKASIPFLPHTSKAIISMLNTENELSEGHSIGQATLLFAKVEDSDIEKQLTKISNKESSDMDAEETGHDELKPTIVYDDFAKLDMRTGIITEAVKVPKADKLLQLTVDMGFETRTVVSGIAEFFQAENIIKQQVVVVCNLAPRKLRGIESNGMILMAEDQDGKLYFVQPGEDINPGSLVN